MSPFTTKVFTDGSYNSSFAGFGVFYGNHDGRNVSLKLKGRGQTSLTCELHAIVYALERALDSRQSKNCLIIYTDCKSAIMALDTKDYFTINPKVMTLVEKGKKLISNIKSHGMKVNIEYIPGHKGKYGNVEADRLARDGAKRGNFYVR